MGLIQSSLRCRSAIAREARCAITSNRADDLGFGIHAAHDTVFHLDEVNVARLVETNFVRFIKFRLPGRATVTGVAPFARAGYRGNNPVARNLAEHVILHVADVQCAVRSSRSTVRIIAVSYTHLRAHETPEHL